MGFTNRYSVNKAQAASTPDDQVPSQYLASLHAMLVQASHLVLLLLPPPQQLLLHNLPEGHPRPDLQGVQPCRRPGSIQEVQQAQQAQLAVDDVDGCNGQLQHSGLLSPLGGALVAEGNEGLLGLTLKGGLGGELGGPGGAGDDPWGQLLENGFIVGGGGVGGG